MPVKFWDYEQTFLQFMMQKPLIKKSLVTFGQKNHNTIKSKLEKGKKKKLIYVRCIVRRSTAVLHYDPTREDHKQFEKIVEEEREKPAVKPSGAKEKQSEEAELPDVSHEKYYEANASLLTNLFGGKEVRWAVRGPQ